MQVQSPTFIKKFIMLWILLGSIMVTNSACSRGTKARRIAALEKDLERFMQLAEELQQQLQASNAQLDQEKHCMHTLRHTIIECQIQAAQEAPQVKMLIEAEQATDESARKCQDDLEENEATYHERQKMLFHQQENENLKKEIKQLQEKLQTNDPELETIDNGETSICSLKKEQYEKQIKGLQEDLQHQQNSINIQDEENTKHEQVMKKRIDQLTCRLKTYENENEQLKEYSNQYDALLDAHTELIDEDRILRRENRNVKLENDALRQERENIMQENHALLLEYNAWLSTI